MMLVSKKFLKNKIKKKIAGAAFLIIKPFIVPIIILLIFILIISTIIVIMLLHIKRLEHRLSVTRQEYLQHWVQPCLSVVYGKVPEYTM